MSRTKTWIPSPIEQKCLRQLDRPGSWEYLRSERPDMSQTISWRPMRRIFFFNLAVFAATFAVLSVAMTSAGVLEAAEIRENLLAGVAMIAAVSAGMAFYATHLYRSAWNRRAAARRGGL